MLLLPIEIHGGRAGARHSVKEKNFRVSIILLHPQGSSMLASRLRLKIDEAVAITVDLIVFEEIKMTHR